jgi:hypothetical protein
MIPPISPTASVGNAMGVLVVGGVGVETPASRSRGILQPLSKIAVPMNSITPKCFRITETSYSF